MTNRVLCVDDDPNILAGFQRSLRKQFSLEIASSGEQALALLETKGPFAVIVADMQMPGMNGVELLNQVETKFPDTVRIMLTGNADQQTAVQAVNEGHVFRFLNKPCAPEVLTWAIDAGLQYYRLVTVEKELLEKTLNGSVRLLMDILSTVEPEGFGRAQKIREYMRHFSQTYQSTQSWELEIAAMLAPIGTVTLPGTLRQKAKAKGALTGTEQTVLIRLPEISSKLLAHIPRLKEVSRIVLYQEKNFDGTGFPDDSLAGEDIPIGARVLKVLSSLVQLEESGFPKAQALEVMRRRRGCYDPRVMDSVFACFDINIAKPKVGAAAMQAMGVKDLQAGQVLLSNVETGDGIMIVMAGTRISTTLLERLRNFAELSGVKEPIYIEG